jgi:hypothetical protein
VVHPRQHEHTQGTRPWRNHRCDRLSFVGVSPRDRGLLRVAVIDERCDGGPLTSEDDDRVCPFDQREGVNATRAG